MNNVSNETNQNKVSQEDQMRIIQMGDQKKSQKTSLNSEVKKKIARPMNPFMVFSQLERRKINEETPDIHNSEVSKILGSRWRDMKTEEKERFVKMAEQIKIDHKKAYPDYKYRPERKKPIVEKSFVNGSENDENSHSKKQKKINIKPEMSPQFGQMSQNTWNQGMRFHPSSGPVHSNSFGMWSAGFPVNGQYFMPSLPLTADQITPPMHQNLMYLNQNTYNLHVHYPHDQGIYPLQGDSFSNRSSSTTTPTTTPPIAPNNGGLDNIAGSFPTMTMPPGYSYGKANVQYHYTMP